MAKGHENLIPIASEAEAREKGRKGGIASGKARREKKAVKTLLNELMDSPCSDFEALEKIADKLGIERDASVKKLFTIAATINTLKEGTLKDLSTLIELLDENEDGNGSLDDILNAIRGVDND